MSATIELPPSLEASLRAELRPGEQVSFAAVPMTRFDSGELLGMLEKWAVPIALSLVLIAFVGSVILLVAGEFDFRDVLERLALPSVLSMTMFMALLRNRDQRRKAARSVYAVTDQRVILLSTWPERSVLSVEGRGIREVYRWPVSPKCGHVRFAGGLVSSEANALMYVPNPRACEAAMRELQARSSAA